MPYKVLPTGEVLCDTPEEAVALSRRLASTNGRSDEMAAISKRIAAGSTGMGLEAVLKLRRAIQGTRIEALVRLLFESAAGKTSDEIQKSFGLERPDAIPGWTGALTKQAAKAGISAPVLIRDRRILPDGKNVAHFKLSSTFREAAKETGWLKTSGKKESD